MRAYLVALWVVARPGVVSAPAEDFRPRTRLAVVAGRWQSCTRSVRHPQWVSKRLWKGGIGAALILILISAISTAAPSGQNPSEVEPGADKTILFDGKGLEGWKKADFYKPGEVEVEDGAIVLKASSISGGMTGVTTTRDDLPRINYELSFEAQRVEGRDFFAAATFPVGDAYLTLINGGWGGTVTGLSSLEGIDASENETGQFFEYENQKWYQFRVQVSDETVRCWINNEKIIDLEHQDRHLGTRLEVRDNEPLGFATWETTGALRNIKVRPLKPEEKEKAAAGGCSMR